MQIGKMMIASMPGKPHCQVTGGGTIGRGEDPEFSIRIDALFLPD